MSSSASPPGPQTIKLPDLSIPQLSQLQKQLSSELESLSNSFTALRQAQAKFRDCLASLSRGLDSKNGQRSILVPLTSSLYVPAELSDTEKVVVDVGTGFYVEKSKDDAKDFYERKVAGLGENLGRLEGVIKAKEEGLRSVEDVLRQKILQANSGPATAGASQAVAA